jgi:hypothetical protein
LVQEEEKKERRSWSKEKLHTMLLIEADKALV